ncbi:MAG: MerR family DNA-binding transcriptional regulator [Hyphomicrobiales bacterium]|nr:MerR family DNA-binding transcriptional regulator [Hyphomicrobiales bacterium]
MEDKQQFSIGDLCREFDVTPRAVRFYQAKGILHPIRRTGGLTRIFDKRDRARLMLTLRGKQAGFTLVEIKELIDLYDSEGGPEKQRLAALEKCRTQVKFLRKQIAELTEAADNLERDCVYLEQRSPECPLKVQAGAAV